MNSYRPIADYGLIGDCHTAALVSKQGSIDWLCAPRFDSPSLFARILDAGSGGHFSISPAGECVSDFEYIPDTGILRTTFRTAGATVVLTDFMPLQPGEEPLRWGKPRAAHRLVRLIEGTEGEVRIALDFQPRPDYAKREAFISAAANGAVLEGSDGSAYRLHSDISLSIAGGTAKGSAIIRAGERKAVVLELDGKSADAAPARDLASALDDLHETLAFWKPWCALCQYRGPYQQAAMRSALTLKMLSYASSGAMIAAPTTSLPEVIGGVRNWDYRYTWIRDASFAAYALLTAGHLEDGAAFFDWVCRVALRCQTEELQSVYGVGGEGRLAEYRLDHLEGYRGSTPVRIGNAASAQFQLDVYGELLDCFHTYRRLGDISEENMRDLWPAYRRQVDHAAGHWREPDSGIWEVRSEPRHFVCSKVMAWVALDRGIKAAEELGLEANLQQWRVERSAIRAEVLDKGYDPALRSFTQSYGARVLDAANLLLPMVGFIDARDERMRSTVEAIERNLTANGLVYRYRGADDGLPGDEATFGVCTFWLVDNLVALGRVDEAKELFERTLSRATPLGLFAEELDPRANVHLGNFPQALTHIGLMNAAVNLTRALGG